MPKHNTLLEKNIYVVLFFILTSRMAFVNEKKKSNGYYNKTAADVFRTHRRLSFCDTDLPNLQVRFPIQYAETLSAFTETLFPDSFNNYAPYYRLLAFQLCYMLILLY